MIREFIKKKRFLIFLIIIFLPSFVKAQKLSFGLGLKVQYAQPVDKAYSSDFMSGLFFSLKIGDNFAIEIDSGNWKSEVKKKKDSLYPGELSITPILVSGLFFIPFNKSFNPYVGIGFGYYFNHFSISEELITIPETTINQDIEDGFGFHAGVGFDYFIAQNLTLNMDIKYSWVSPQGTTIISDMNSGRKEEVFDINSNNILYRIGVRIYF